MDILNLSLSELRDLRIPKYDLLMKRFFSLEFSSLRKMLCIPCGERLSEEFGDFDGLRMDALMRHDDRLYHLEFQAQNHPMMHQRMLAYYRKLARQYTDLKTGDGPEINQLVLYFGSESIGMRTFIRRDRFRFLYRMRSIKAFYHGWSQRLWDSESPENWVLHLLCDLDYFEENWLEIGGRIRALPEIYHPSTAEVRALLLIACILRKIPRETQEMIEKMIKVDIEQSEIFKAVFNRGAEYSRTQFYLDEIETMIARQDLVFDFTKRSDLATAEPTEIGSFFRGLMDATDRQAFLDERSVGRRF